VLNVIDASDDALSVARRNLSKFDNVRYYCASVADLPLADDSQDFGYSLGVLHHIPDTRAGLAACVKKLKPGAPFLVYLYYRFDNRPAWFQAIWRISDALRRIVSRLPHGARYAVSQMLAIFAYWPLARIALLVQKVGLAPDLIPLSFYRDKSFYTMRTDALDRFGTRLEQRFTRREVERMMTDSGLGDVRFGDGEPFWCAVGRRME
jgi:SAM-dependent methyltransferase